MPFWTTHIGSSSPLETVSQPKFPEFVPSNVRSGKQHEREVHMNTALIPDCQTTQAVKPGDGPFNEPAVTPQSFFRLNATASDSRDHSALSHIGAVARGVIPLVRMEFLGPLNRSPNFTGNGRQIVDHRFDRERVRDVGSGESNHEWNPTGVNKKMLFAASFPTIRRARTGCFAPFFARTVVLSRITRWRSIRPLALNRRMTTACIFDHTPAACQSRMRLQAVTPLPHPGALGICRQAMPVSRT